MESIEEVMENLSLSLKTEKGNEWEEKGAREVGGDTGGEGVLGAVSKEKGNDDENEHIIGVIGEVLKKKKEVLQRATDM
jgi:hypothetical protein